MASRTYSDAISSLNSLQSNAAALAAGRLESNGLSIMIEYLERIGHTCEDLNKLNVIHITGTKGKGSTSAFTDSVLRHVKPNWKVGLYTSPHLVAVRERIRIDGEPLSEEEFAHYFFEVWDRLEQNGPRTPTFPAKPGYFRYLTLMAYHTFLSKRVDATILEVGIGGHSDSTNIVPKPIVTGITALGLDHTDILGKTIEAIAWQKGGIYKKGVPALTVDQPEKGMAVLRERAEQLQASYFMVVPHFPGHKSVKLGLAGKHQIQNACLAVQMAQIFICSVEDSNPSPDSLSKLPEQFLVGLENTKWPGRCQTVLDPTYPDISWHLDGAHTTSSLSYCMQWFVRPGVALALEQRPTRILVFNCTGRRSAHPFLETILEHIRDLLLQHERGERVETFFDHVMFCSNVTYADGSFKGDLTSRTISSADLTNQHELASSWSQLVPTFPNNAIHVLPSIDHAVQTIRRLSEGSSEKISVLVTGSLHLVGGVIEVAGLSSVAL